MGIQHTSHRAVIDDTQDNLHTMSLNQTVRRLFSGRTGSLLGQLGGQRLVGSSSVSPSILESQADLAQLSAFNPGLVIFDKDGTLVCFHTMWNSWCEQLAQRMNAETDRELSDEVYRLMGYDSEKREIKMGMLAEKTHPYIRDKVVEMLVAQGFSQWEAAEVLEKTWKDTQENMQIKMTGNLRALFVRLKERDIKIAICTSDSRE